MLFQALGVRMNSQAKYRSALLGVAVVVAMLMAGPAFGATYYVPDNFGSIQEALSSPSVVNGDYIIVRDGTYTGANNKNLDFGGKAITLRSENGAANCTIDCEGDGRGFYFHSGETSASVVDGFTIINGSPPLGGGAIYCFAASSPTITNCVITNNTGILGGGILCNSGSSPTITNCDISGNSAGYGGGINCTSDSSPIISNCTITGNTATSYGGGIRCAYDSNAVIIGSTISGNNANLQGGGIHCYSYSSPSVANCEITGNTAGDSGGGFYCDYYSSPAISHCTVSGNTAVNFGGGIYSFYSSAPTLTNSIFWGDSAALGNEIVVGTATYPASVIVNYSDVEGSSAAAYVESGCTLTWGTGNIDSDPMFVGGGDYHLSNVSPCIDTGTDAGVATDMDGEARPQGAGYDMGSDEFAGPCAYSILPTSDSIVAGGGSGGTDVTAPVGCGWLATSNDGWITVISGDSGNGDGTVNYAVAPNPSSIPRSGTITIGTETLTIDQAGVPCTYSILPTSATPGSGGGADSTVVTAPGGCAWTATSNDGWITVISGDSGNGDGTVNYAVAPNPSSIPRSGTITIGTETFTVDQAGAPCVYSILPTNVTPGSGGVVDSTVVTAPGGCAWTATSNDGWITVISGGSGSGAGIVGYGVDPNPSSIPRSGTITIGTETFTVDQAGATCAYSIFPANVNPDSAGGTDNITVTAPGGCAWTSTSNDFWITIDSGSSGNGNGTIAYTVDPNPDVAPRTGTITVETETFTVYQAGSAPLPYYVPDDYGTIQAALSGVPEDSVIIVRDGVYTGPGNRDLRFNGKALTLRSENGPDNCIIDCENVTGGFVFWAGVTNSAVVDGFTVLNGNAGYGGGVYAVNSSPTIRNCVFKGGSAAYGGGLCLSTSSAQIINCTIVENNGDYGAGGMFFYNSDAMILNCTISANTATSGGGVFLFMSTPTFSNSIIAGNSAPYGPQILLATYSDMTVSHSNVEGGQAAAYVEPNSSFLWGAGNIDADPLFVGGGDYHLTTHSPCIDTGGDGGLVNDIDDDLRPEAAGYDMGSDEYSNVYYVPDDYPNIQQAMYGVPDDCIVVVRDGVYTGPENRHIDFNDRAVILKSENGPANCIIDCQGADGGFVFWRGETAASVLDGFTITNGASSYGGGIYAVNSSPTIRNCVIKNSSAAYGGGVCLSVSSASLTNCTIVDNSATYGAAGIFSYVSDPVIKHCTISGNSAISGGGVFFYNSDPSMTNCVIAGNSATYGPQIVLTVVSNLDVSYSNIEGGQWMAYVEPDCALTWGAGNIDSDPLFVGGGDYHLTAGSPCIDAGTDAGVYRDIDGEDRPFGPASDIGSDEY